VGGGADRQVPDVFDVPGGTLRITLAGKSRGRYGAIYATCEHKKHKPAGACRRQKNLKNIDLAIKHCLRWIQEAVKKRDKKKHIGFKVLDSMCRDVAIPDALTEFKKLCTDHRAARLAAAEGDT
jgi:hypothetical protein